ncbi:tellurite resistance protein TehB [Bremerella volcania]|uniref:Tellurite resistance protein TehB n=1 Tax=Bremerella volcania TaxID=2527984 RepID=A0A518CA74_9BACT|nr:class I SAM-dependent methyltransferase [Bremerella volcania]QDU76127.1 tellurite resistance protein TehB [Bremerella volcania]
MSEDVQEFWNERFGRDEYIYGTAPNTFLKASIQHFPKNAKILCIAEGEGRNALFLCQQGHEVHAVDLSTEGKAKAERLAAEHGVTLQYTLGDLNDYDYGENRWDAIVSIFAHVDSASRKNIYQKAIASLKEGGIFLLESYHPRQLEYGTGGPKDVDMLVTLEDLRGHFQGLPPLHEAERERDVTEGSFHTGNAYVTQFIARKSN